MANELEKISKTISEYYDRRTALDMDYRNYMEKQVEIGTNIQTSINEQTFAIVASQAVLANTFKQEFNGINNTLNMGFYSVNNTLNQGFSSVSNQLGNMTVAFSMGFARVENALDRMSNIMSTPLFTAFKELYCRAAERYRKGQFEEALEDTQAALEKDRTDPTAWFLQGKIYAFGVSEDCNIIDLDKSIDAFTKAAKYNKPNIVDSDEARKMSAEIYFYLGLAQYSKSNDLLRENKNAESSEMLKKAQSSFEQSYQYSNDMLESLFNIARCKALQGEVSGAINDLETLVLRERNYCIKVYDDNDFSSIFEQFANLINKLKSIAIRYAKDDYMRVSSITAELKSLGGWPTETIPTNFTEELPYFDILYYAKDFKRIISILDKAILDKKQSIENDKLRAREAEEARRKAEWEERRAKIEAEEAKIKAEREAEEDKKRQERWAREAEERKAKEAERKRNRQLWAIFSIIAGAIIGLFCLSPIVEYKDVSSDKSFEIFVAIMGLIIFIPITYLVISMTLDRFNKDIGNPIMEVLDGYFNAGCFVLILVIVSGCLLFGYRSIIGGDIIGVLTGALIGAFIWLKVTKKT